MAKKKLIILGTAHPFRGGLASFNERLAIEYQSKGYDVEMWNFSLQYPNFLFPGKTQYTDEAADDQLKIVRKVNSINPLNWFKVGHELRKLQPELIITKFWIPFIGPSLGTICRIARKNKKTKVISILDNVIPHEKRPGDDLLTSYFVKSIDAFVAMSKSVLNDLRTFTQQKPASFNPHPIFDNFGASISKQEAIQKLGLDPDFKYILFFGFIRDYKGLDLLLEAFHLSALSQKNVKLIVAGEYYTDREKYDQQIELLGLKDHIILHHDFIPNSRVAEYFCASDIIAQPYKSATQSGVTQIAYHFNKPMLVTNVGGLAEIVPHQKAGYVVDVNPAEIASALKSYFDEKKEEEMTSFVAKEKEKYSWSAMVNTLNELYSQL